MHLPERGRSIGEELQARLTKYNIECRLGERQLDRAGFPPLDGQAFGQRRRAGHHDHRRAYIQPGDAAGAAELARRDAGNDPGSTSDVQHPIPLPQTSGLHEFIRPRSENNRD